MQRNTLFFIAFFLVNFLFSQTTWDGAAWDLGEPDANTEAIIAGPLMLSQMSGQPHNLVCHSLTIELGAFITFDVNNSTIQVNGKGAMAGITTITTNQSRPIVLNPSITGCKFEVNMAAIAPAGNVSLSPGILNIPSGLQFDVIQNAAPGEGLFETGGLLLIEAGGFIKCTGVHTELSDLFDGEVQFKQTGKSPTTAYNLWSDPTAATTTLTTQFNSPGAAYSFTDGGTDATAWNSHTGDMATATGYMVTGAASNTYTFTGAVNSGNITRSTSASGFILAGNPYPCFIDIYDGTNGILDKNAASTAVYLWVDDLTGGSGFASSDYSVCNSGGCTQVNSVTPGGNIAVGQGFFVNMSTSADVKFQEVMQVGTSESFHKLLPNNQQKIWLNLLDTASRLTETIIVFSQDGTSGKDRLLDAEKHSLGDIAVYSFLQGDRQAIQGFPTLTSSQVIPLGLKVSDSGQYTIRIKNTENLPLGTSLVIEDQLTNTFHSIDSSDYVLSLNQDTIDNRFFLHVNLLSTDVATNLSKLLNVYSLSDNIMIDGLLNLGDIQSIEVFNLSGQLIDRNIYNVSLESIALSGMPEGMLFVRINADKGSFVKKIFN